ncbi:MAG: hypothetical protein HLUCCO02_12090 [Idiomarinaceae bacterium HL-53]|nr:MAG: hypothetical protein HLUCCO02_12090 [Idiomarinaceae bacterium HL-53]CUS49395.1 hypothetical protein Ga0003345_2388 [Idiomarinaceae bacterium HL-53]
MQMTGSVVVMLATLTTLPDNITSECLNVSSTIPAWRVDESSPAVFKLEAARIKPQIETLLRTHWQVQQVVWYADPHHIWPTEFELQAHSWDALLAKILQPYQLRVSLHENHTAVVDYLPHAVQP